MRMFTQPLEEYKEITELKKCLRAKKTPVQATGCIDSQKCHFMAAVGGEYRNRLIITYNELKAKEIYEDYKLYDKNVFYYPPKDILFYSADIHGNAIVRERLASIQKLVQKEPLTVVTTIDGGLDRLLPLSEIASKVIRIKETDTIVLEDLRRQLVQLGYEKQGQVEARGEFAVRGGILDIFPLTEEAPFRIELWGDEIDSIRIFDVSSQRSIERVDEITIFPAAELILEESMIQKGLKKIEQELKTYTTALRKEAKNEEAHRIEEIISEFKENISYSQGLVGLDSYIKFFFDKTVSFFEYFAEDSILFLDEPSRAAERGEAVSLEFSESMISRVEKGYILPSQMDAVFEYKALFASLAKKNTVFVSTMDYKTKNLAAAQKYDLTVKTANPYNNNFELLVKDLTEWKSKGYRVILLAATKSRAQRLADDLLDYNLNAVYTENMDREILPRELVVSSGRLHRGFEYPLLKFVIISESDIFGEEKKKKKKKKSTYEGRKINSFHDLAAGDYIVHENHGLGIYKGIEKIEVDKVVKDYIKLEYGGGDVLYILASGLDVIQKYAGADGRKPKLNKLNSVEWKNTKTRVKAAVQGIADDLVRLYVARQSKPGFAYGKDTVWQSEFEELFPYEETDDQLKAIADTKRDMESGKIMDRLICGDVGYGKTEIAVRAAFKAVSDSKQVVFLVPTTILAQQHYNTFIQRMMDFPISIEMLSRFRTQAQQKSALDKLRRGELDILIGTHRVLSADVVFKDLGLLIVDEEQRFGVTHKEKIKKLKETVDVLTLTATPIPRTLHMSLIGIRDMSILEEPPIDRLPVQTYVLEHNDELIREAVSRELARGGQVYYVYNRVTGIDEITNSIAKLVPDAAVAFAHGQMSERQLEKIMYEFINGTVDVLVSTTIIETGLDISNVNTIIIDDADRFGLSQLYQLRGRVGRSSRTSYAFLMYKRNKLLKEIAEKRLQAIKEFTELGSGFKISMRDLEIRGAGSILGAQQSGHMESVGYDLYCKMLNEAVKRSKGEEVEEEQFDTVMDLDIDAYIPSDYIKNEMLKLDMYKRTAGIESEEELSDMLEELTDRFGDVPDSVSNLLNIALLKHKAHKIYAVSLLQKGMEVKISMHRHAKVNVGKIPVLLGKYKNGMKMIPGTVPCFIYQLPETVKKGKASRPDAGLVIRHIHEVLSEFQVLLT